MHRGSNPRWGVGPVAGQAVPSPQQPDRPLPHSSGGSDVQCRIALARPFGRQPDKPVRVARDEPPQNAQNADPMTRKTSDVRSLRIAAAFSLLFLGIMVVALYPDWRSEER